MLKFEETIVAPATVPGTGAISMIRISGPSALQIADAVVSFRKGRVCDMEAGRVKFGTISKDGVLLDEVLVSIYRAPHSYTGEDSVEISCHASAYIVSEIIGMVVSSGARLALPGEFTQRAFINGKMDLSQAEAVADVISSEDKASHDLAFRQLKGGVSSEMASLRAELLEMTSLLELELDFSEEDVEFADRGRLTGLLDHAVEKVGSLASSFKFGNAVKNGVPVVIVGAANAGKSTLLNRILGEERAIVSPVPGTTRDTVEESIVLDGIKYRFIDTAGIRKSDDEVENIGIGRSFDSANKAEIVIVVVDSLSMEEGAISEIFKRIDAEGKLVVVAVNKVDLLQSCESENSFKNALSGREFTLNKFVISKNKIVSLLINNNIDINHLSFHPISAKNGNGVRNMLSFISSKQKERMSSASDSDSVTITNLRHFEALSSALVQLESARASLLSGLSSELVSEDLHAALRTLGSITGEITTDEVLGEIFGKFCIGK